jgi:very-short-patch-repair endonuclease
MMRYHLWSAGYTDLQPNLNIRSADHRFIARGDLVDFARKIVVEYDGAHHLTREGQARDAHRRLELAAEGWLEVTVVPEDLRPPSRLLSKVRRAYQLR